MGNSPRRKGFVLIATCVALTVLLGMAAVGIDAGRMYVIKSELQAFSDAAALSAAMQLDGGASGIARAREAAARLAEGPHAMKWDMGTKAITGVSCSFATGGDSAQATAWQANPRGAGGYRLVRVTASAQAPLVFMRIFEPRTASTVAVSSVAMKTDDSARLVE